MKEFFIFIVLLVAVEGYKDYDIDEVRKMPHFEHYGYPLPNNSYIYSRDVANDIGGALLCKNGDKKPLYGKWQYPNGGDIPRDDSSHCIYYRNTSQQISLHRMRSCPDYYTSVPAGLWRCVFANSSEDMQTLYIYIGNRRRSDSYYGELNKSVSMNFTLHTEPNASVPEFTISCRTHGGPATTVQWTADQPGENTTSQYILDEHYKSEYDNRLLVKGRRSGNYNCTVWNNIRYYLSNDKIIVKVNGSILVKVADKPSNLKAIISEFNNTHINISVSWKSATGDATGYVIYYRSNEGTVHSMEVPKKETESFPLHLPRKDFYNISIVAVLLDNLPSLESQPVTVHVESFNSTRSQNEPSRLIKDDITTNLEYNISVTHHTLSSCKGKESDDNRSAVVGSVGGVMCLIIVSQSVAIVILLLRQRAIKRAWLTCKKTETCSKSTTGVMSVTVDPEHEMMGLQKKDIVHQ